MAADLDPLGITALHVFTFNQVANTVAWQIDVGGGATFLDNTELGKAEPDNTEKVVQRGLSV
jgi:hypothetical protein